MNKKILFSLTLVIIILITLLWYIHGSPSTMGKRSNSLVRVTNTTSSIENSEYNITETPRACPPIHGSFIKLSILNSNVPVEIIDCNNTLDIYMYSSREANLHIEISVTNLQSLTSFRAGDVIGIVNGTLDYKAELLFIIGNNYYRIVNSRGIRAEIVSLENGKQFILKITNLENSFESIVITLLINIRVRIYFVESGLDYGWMFADYTLNIHR